MKKELSIFAFFSSEAFSRVYVDGIESTRALSVDDVRLIIFFYTLVFEENELPTWTCNAILKAINGCLLCLLYCAYMRWLLSSMDFHPTHLIRVCMQEKS